MNAPLEGKNVLLGISGGIAAYKGPMIVRALTGVGAQVRVVMTRSANQFVTPLALQAVSHNSVGQDLFDPAYEAQIGHIELARWADVVLLAPATAHLIARMAHGMCDDLLTTVLCATRAPVLISPAMNTQMLLHPAVQANIQTLRQRDGHHIIEPDSGQLACNEVGAGRMPDPPVLLDAVLSALTPKSLLGKRVLVTAGPTREAIDPVRFITNPSSGKMGFAIATAAARRGAHVTLIAGPTGLDDPIGVHRINVTSAQDMFDAVMAHAKAQDFIVKSAAVADWRPASQAEHKLKKQPGQMHLTMERTRDILATLGAMDDQTRPMLIGFAAETRDIEHYARGKLARKNLDMIVANQVKGPSSAFGADRSSVLFIDRDGRTAPFGPNTKDEIAATLWSRALTLSPRDSGHDATDKAT